MHIASACNFFCNFYHSITFQLLVYRYFLHSFISKLSIHTYVLWEWTSEPICKTWAMQFSNSHARTFIRLNSVVYIFSLLGILCLAWNFLLSVQKRKAEIALNSFMMESEDGTMVFKWLVCQKNSSSYFFTVFYEKNWIHVFFTYLISSIWFQAITIFLNKALFKFSVIVKETCKASKGHKCDF